MKAKARVIQGSVRAVAKNTGGLMAVAYTMQNGIKSLAEPTDDTVLLAVASILPNGVKSKGLPTDETGVHRFMQVMPEEQQELVWLVPQYGVDYSIITSTGLKWKIQ